MTQKTTRAAEKFIMEFQKKELKVEIESYRLIPENGFIQSSSNGGFAPGKVKITSVQVSVDQNNTRLLMNLISKKNNHKSSLDGYFKDISILKNSKKVCDLSDCVVYFTSTQPFKYGENLVKIEFQGGTFHF